MWRKELNGDNEGWSFLSCFAKTWLDPIADSLAQILLLAPTFQISYSCSRHHNTAISLFQTNTICTTFGGGGLQ